MTLTFNTVSAFKNALRDVPVELLQYWYYDEDSKTYKLVVRKEIKRAA